jgi:hypothetical protein
MEVKIYIHIFITMPRSVVSGFQHIRGIYHLHLLLNAVLNFSMSNILIVTVMFKGFTSM